MLGHEPLVQRSDCPIELVGVMICHTGNDFSVGLKLIEIISTDVFTPVYVLEDICFHIELSADSSSLLDASPPSGQAGTNHIESVSLELTYMCA